MISIWRQELALVEKQEITAPGLRRIVAIDSDECLVFKEFWEAALS